MKRIAHSLGLAALSLAFVGCSPTAEKPETPTGDGGDSSTAKKGVIAYSPLTLSNPFFKVIGDHIKAEAEKNGYEALMVDPDMDVKKQSDQIDDFIASEVTAIILVPCDRLSIGPAVKAANAEGIPVFTVDAKCAAEGAEIAGHVGTDNFQGGELAGQAMIKALGENGGKVLILDFKKAHSCVLRVAGFKKVIDAHNAGRTTGKIEIVAELNGNGARTEGYQSTADALQAHDNLDAVFAINDPSALGAYTAILSTCSPRCGKISETGLPHSPRGVNLNGDFIRLPTEFLKKPVVFLNSGSNSRIDLPFHFSSLGL
ncbi:MAG: substrate-binding domain-containing protein [Verrucomicrobia bacterium]|nr:substrate-binding domain-containing protein [Verrucomicrobiota bacterium]